MHCWKVPLLPGVVREAEVAFDNVFEESDGKGVDELEDHVAENRAHRIESLVSLADVCQSCFIQQNPLHNKDRNLLRGTKGGMVVNLEEILSSKLKSRTATRGRTYSFGELAASLHDTKAERDDLGREQECDNIRVVVLQEQKENKETSAAN